jgi:hypothetical protein
MLIITFFLLQKKLNGWYFFPEHVAYIKPDWLLVKGKIRYFFEILFLQQYRYVTFLIVPILAFVTYLRQKLVGHLLPIGLSIIIYLFIGEHLGWVSRKAVIPLLFGYLVYQIIWINKQNKTVSNEGKRLLAISMIFTVLYLVFHSLNFFSTRYLLTVATILFITLAYLIDFYLVTLPNYTVYISICLIMGAHLLSYQKQANATDTELSAFDAMQVQQQMISFAEKKKLYGKHIVAPSFLQQEHLLKPLTGFRNTTDSFHYVSKTITANTEIVMIENVEIDSTDFAAQVHPPAFRLLFNVNKGNVSGYIYERSHK